MKSWPMIEPVARPSTGWRKGAACRRQEARFRKPCVRAAGDHADVISKSLIRRKKYAAAARHTGKATWLAESADTWPPATLDRATNPDKADLLSAPPATRTAGDHAGVIAKSPFAKKRQMTETVARPNVAGVHVGVNAESLVPKN